MKKGLAMLLALMMMVGLFVACSPATEQPAQSSNTLAPTPTVSDTTTPDVETPPESVVLNITWWGSQGHHDYTQQFLDLYTQQNPHVTFQAIPAGWDGYFDKLSTQDAGGNMPDILQMDYLYIATYSRNNALADLQSFVDSGIIDLKNIDSNLYSAGNIDGKLSGITRSSSIFTFPYNPDVLAEAGVTAPTPSWIWKDFENMCLQVKEKTGKYGFAANVIDTNILNYWVRQYNKPLFAADSKSLGYDDDTIFVDFAEWQNHLVAAEAMPNPDQWLQISSFGKEAGPVITGDGAFTGEWSNYIKIPYGIMPRRPGDIAEFYADALKAEKLFGWKAKHSLIEMCEDSWHFERQNAGGVG